MSGRLCPGIGAHQMSAQPTTSLPTEVPTAATGERRSPLAFIIDEEGSIRQFVSLILQGCGVDTIEFSEGASFRETTIARTPDLVFLNVNLEAQDAVQTIEMLSKAGFAGDVQLMSSRGSAVLDTVKQAGDQLKLRMLPVLKKPFETSAIQKIMSELKLGHGPAPSGVKITLAEALKNNWVEFWYQPKVDLRRKQLAGAEAFARVCHPQHGILTPDCFMPGADDASILTLAEAALVSALKSGLTLSRFGVNLRIAINVPFKCLVKLPVGEIVRQHRPQVDNWPGLMIDVTEEQIVSEITLANELSKKFAEHNVRLAIDDFGKRYASLVKLKELPFAEMKLDRSFVVGCGTDKVHAPICKTVIDLAHSFGALAVGIGLEKASDTMALISMGCDLGQGFLFGQPMPQERFISLLKQRVTVRPAAAAAASAAAPAAPALQGA
jgi:EAL domain-containing protein (putative c-di-GMP-specific phosphodiesterase class I)/CheY-like chemotaxis protein